MYAEAVLSVFSQRYAGARDKFISAVETSSIVERVNNIIHPVRGPKNERLFCDIAWAGSPKAKNILVLVSGVHGVEGELVQQFNLILWDVTDGYPPMSVLLWYMR